MPYTGWGNVAFVADSSNGSLPLLRPFLMNRPHGTERLSERDWDRLLNLIDQFQEQWQKVADPVGGIDLRDLLPPPNDPIREPALYELVKADMELRGRRGQSVRLDHYAKKYSELGA